MSFLTVQGVKLISHVREPLFRAMCLIPRAKGRFKPKFCALHFCGGSCVMPHVLNSAALKTFP